MAQSGFEFCSMDLVFATGPCLPYSAFPQKVQIND